MKVIEKHGEIADIVEIDFDPLNKDEGVYNLIVKSDNGDTIYSRKAPLNLDVYGDIEAGKNIKVTILRRNKSDNWIFPNKWEFENIQDCGWINNLKRPLRADGTGDQLIAFFQDAFLVKDDKGDYALFYLKDYIVDKIEVVEKTK